MLAETADQVPDGTQPVQPLESIELLGVGIHRLDAASALKVILGFIRSGRPHMVVTADASGVVLAQKDPEFRDIVNRADLVTPDGSGILMGAGLLGTPLIERVCGVDMARELCRASGPEGFSIFFLGAEPGVAEAAVEKLKIECPELRVAGTHHGYFSANDEAEVVAKVRNSGANVLLAAMGIPRQEKWIAAHLHELGVSIAMGVGGTFDVFSGRIKRAPVWMQRHGLEWAYRLARDPRKITKVMLLPRFLVMVYRQKLSRR